jgi:hypothetical protein
MIDARETSDGKVLRRVNTTRGAIHQLERLGDLVGCAFSSGIILK